MEGMEEKENSIIPHTILPPNMTFPRKAMKRENMVLSFGSDGKLLRTANVYFTAATE